MLRQMVVTQDLWILSVGVDNNPWGQYQHLIPKIDYSAVKCTVREHQLY
jgi:hypothetical protein